MNKNETVTTSQNRAVIYARYSSASQNEATVETQIKKGKELAKKYSKTIVGIYADKMMTGTTDRRPDFLKLLTDARESKFDYVLLYSESRFSRNYRQSKKHFNELREFDVNVITPNVNYEEQDEFIADTLWNFFAKNSEQYSKDLSRVIRDNVLRSLCNGTSIGGNRLLGYKTNPDTKKIEIVPEEASIVRDIFNQIAQGVPLTKVYENINNYGYRTAKGMLFTVYSFQHAIRNRKYIGEYSFNGVDYPDQFPQIIDKDLFERVQNILDEKSHRNGHGRAKTDYLLSGKIFCGYCGGGLNGTTTRKKGIPHYYYNCSNNYASRRTCHKVSENKVQLETAIIETVKNHLNGSLDLNKSASLVANLLARKFRDEYEKPLKSEIRSIETDINNALNAFTKTDSKIIHKSLEEKIETLTALKVKKETELNGYAGGSAYSECDILKFAEEVLIGNSLDVNLNRYIIANFINAVYVWDDRIEIVYSFGNNNEKLLLADRLSYEI